MVCSIDIIYLIFLGNFLDKDMNLEKGPKNFGTKYAIFYGVK